MKLILNIIFSAFFVLSLARMGTGAAKKVGDYYTAIKTEKDVLNGDNIKQLLQQVKDGGNDLSNLKPEDADAVTKLLQRVKAEANARGLSDLEQNTDNALAALKGASSTVATLTHITEADINALQSVTSVARNDGSRAINSVQKLVNEGKALVIKPEANSPLYYTWS